ncbi:MAG: histidine phosphatase family protein [Proteobacteria bacterium]|nr:histidine phosphatase family protein [Pseudomonadota bacterium]
MASIYVIRHGQASFGQENYDKLSPLGCRQAVVLGEYLRDCGIHFDAIYSGDLQRQRKTAELAAAVQPRAPQHHIDSGFNEIQNEEQFDELLPTVLKNNPALQALLDTGLNLSKDYQKVLKEVFNYWVSPDCPASDIQSWENFDETVNNALRNIIRTEGSGKTVGLFTSGGTIATIVAQVLGLSSEHVYSFYEPVINCSVTQLFYSGDRVSLSYFNDHSFLDILGVQKGEKLVTYR